MRENLENRIAVVGMGCRFPGAESPAEFWRNLKAGVESLTFFSEDELRESGVAELWLSDPNYVKASTILKDIESFDARFFDVTAVEAQSMDPQHRLLLECAWEALESAGHSSSEASQPVAVFAGVRINEYLLFRLPKVDMSGLTTQSQLEGFQRLVANDKDFAATRISHKLKLGGPSMTVQSACSTSLVAIHMACRSLLNGECDLALAGGASVRVPQRAGYLHTEGMISSADGHTRSFDAAASGTVFGSGAGIVALRRLADALRDGDPIQAVILGSAVNNDAGSGKNFTAPSREGQLRVLAEAYGVAGVSPATVGYIEAHGTATALGDSAELGALLDLFRGHASKPEACAIGSVKTNIGHLIHAAGVAGLMKAVLMLKHGELVPSLNFRHPNPNVELSGSPLYVNVENRPWPVNGSARRAGVSGFGVGGTNAHIVLEEFTPARRLPAEDPAEVAPYSVLALSAKDPMALRDLANRYSDFFNDSPAPALPPVCHTAAVGRVHFEHRLAVSGPDARTVEQRLRAFVRDGRSPGVASGRARPGGERPKVAFLFTGLGSQYRAMGCDLYRTHAFFRSKIDECGELLRPYLPEPLTAILESQEMLEQAEYAQPTLFALEHALASLWISWGIEPDVVLGHSFGEYAAAQVAGVFSLEDGLRVAARRGKIIKALSRPGQMAVVFAGAERIAAILETVPGVSVAAYNGPSSCSISGDFEAIRQARERCGAAGIQTASITGNLPFHSVLMEPCLPAIGREIEQCRMSAPGPKFISSLTGVRAQDAELNTPDYWMRQTREPVRFADAMSALRRENCDVLIEIGPTAHLLALGRECWPESSAVWLPTLRANRPAWRQISESVGELYTHGADINWKSFYQGFGMAHTRIELPTYPFQRSRHWVDAPGEADPLVRGRPPGGLPQESRHPLLGVLLESPLPQKQFQARISPGTAAYLQDHLILGKVLFPGAAYIETARAAWAEACADDGPVAIENLTMQRALLLDESGSQILHTVLEPQDGGRATVKIFSGESASGEPGPRWLLHAECQVRSAVQPRPASVSVDQIRRTCTISVPVEPFYESKLRRGTGGGRSYQSIRELWQGQGESLSRVELARTPGEHRPALNPAALSCCIQAGGEDVIESLQASFAGGAHLPYLWERIHIYGPLPENMWSHIREISNAPDLRTVEATIFDDAGNVLVMIEGLHFRRATKEALLRHAQPSRVDEDLLYELVWRAAPGPARDVRAPGRPGRWIVEGPDSLAEQLSAMLDAGGPLCGVIHIAALAGNGGDPAAFEQSLCEKALELVKGILNQGGSPLAPKLVFVTRGAQCTGLETGPLGLAGSTLWGFGKAILREHPGLGCRIVDLDPAVPVVDALQYLAAELGAEDGEPLIAWRDGRRLVPRLERCRPVANGGSYTVKLERPGTLSSLTIHRRAIPKPGPGQVVVRVYATGLNFRDVLIGLGRIPGQPGYEFSGEIVDLGEGVDDLEVGMAVYGILRGQIASHVVAEAIWLAPKPRNLTFADAASLPIVFVTALCGLRDIAGLRSGERVLIHAAAGGVGQAAIQVAKLLGAQVFATASHKKWEFLRSLGVEQIADSRKLGFAREILAATGGEGVDVILNTLAGELNEESARTLKPGGRFIELGLSNPAFPPLSIFERSQQHPGFIRRLLTEIAGNFESGVLKLPPVQVFPLEAAGRALERMASGKHIGKFVIAQASGQSSGIRIAGDATYLITGGLGGLGRSVANWLADRGARSLALIGRRTPDAQGAAFIESLRARGVTILAAPVDVADRVQMESLFTQIEKELPPLRGVVHAAGVLNDGTLLEMNRARLLSVLKPKLDGTWNLHRLTENRALDFFVLFSSTSGLWGAPGQTNYAAANAFLDSVAHYRRQRGLPAISIDWSAWAEVGMAAAMDRHSERYRLAKGLGKISPQAGVNIFGWAINQPRTQFAASKVDWRLFGQLQAGGGLAGFFSALTATSPSAEPRAMEHPAQRILVTDGEERKRAVLDHILDCTASVLGLDRTVLRADRPLQDYGLDSLMALQLRNRVMAPLLDVHIPWAHFLGAGSISDLGDIVAAALESSRGLSLHAAAGAGVQEGAI